MALLVRKGWKKKNSKREKEGERERDREKKRGGSSRSDIHPDELLVPFIVLAILMRNAWLFSIRMPRGAIIKMTSWKRKVTQRVIRETER